MQSPRWGVGLAFGAPPICDAMYLNHTQLVTLMASTTMDLVENEWTRIEGLNVCGGSLTLTMQRKHPTITA